MGVLHTLRPTLRTDYDRVADQVFETHKNDALMRALAPVASEQITIVSFGLTEIIQTMLRNTRFRDCQIVASTPDRLVADRARGKLEMLSEAGLRPNTEHDAVITDSKRDDQDLLEHVHHGFHIKWQ